jgi:hypothetical protein
MNLRGGRSSVSFPSKKLFAVIPFLAALCVLVTGCPQNNYTVELKPQTNAVERTLIFYRADGAASNGTPNYESFPSNELAKITLSYPSSEIKKDGYRLTAVGKFAGRLPDDVGGAGSFTNLQSPLGDVGFYLERFRGNDDFAAQTLARFKAADQITGLVIGWAQKQFGRNPGYENLRKFLDEDFRNDLKNVAQYCWLGNASAISNTNASEEFAIRFGQYLLERGYLKLSDLSAAYLIFQGDTFTLLPLLHRLAIEKMGIPASHPVPQSLDILSNPDALGKSWSNYLARTPVYLAKVREWKIQKKSNPKLVAPSPIDVLGDPVEQLIGMLWMSGENDHLTVKLQLNHAPLHSNGKWIDGQVIWQTDLDNNPSALPVICYADWSTPSVPFQQKHFGRVILDGQNLSEYCLWRNSLSPDRETEWDSFVARLNPAQDLAKQLAAFHWSSSPESLTAKNVQDDLEIGRKLLTGALKEAGETKSDSAAAH